MNCCLDLTRDHFDTVDFCEALFFFDPTRALPAQLSFPVWGVTLLTTVSDQPLKVLRGNFHLVGSDYWYVGGYAILSFQDLSGGQMRVALYDPESAPPGDFFRRPDGSPITLTRSWVGPLDAETYEYRFGPRLAWPHGSCDLKLYARGPVTLQFSVDACVPVNAYTKHPEWYSCPDDPDRPQANEPARPSLS